MMKNKYDIYSLDTQLSEDSDDQKNKTFQPPLFSDELKKSLNIRSILFQLIIGLLILFCSIPFFLGIRIVINKNFDAIEQKLNPYKDYNNFLIHGQRCFTNGDYDNAIQYYTKAHDWAFARKTNSMAGIACYNRGDCYCAKGKLELALDDFELAGKYNPTISTKKDVNEVQEKRITLCLYFAEKSFQNNDIISVFNYYRRALNFNKLLAISNDWQMQCNVSLRIRIYKMRISVLPESGYKKIIKADSIWLELNNEYLNKDNTEYTNKSHSIYDTRGLDSNYDLSSAEWHYDQCDYKSARLLLEKVIVKKEFNELSPTMQKKFHELIQSLQFLDSNSKSESQIQSE
jgi:tetratricopeptide (TPR) repeat protein